MKKNKLLINSKYIEIQCEKGDTETLSKAREIPYVHENRTKTRFRTTAKNIAQVLKLFRGIDEFNIDELPENIRAIYDRVLFEELDTQKLLIDGPRQPKEWLFEHQQLGRELAEVNSRYAFFYDTRTGKTPMSLQIIADDIAKHPEHKWLVLCPLILIQNAWLEDAEKFFPEMQVVNLHDATKAKRLKKFKLPANLYLTNIESFVGYREHIEALGIHGCIVDESSSMKSSSSKFGKAAVEYAKELDRWYLLSGTPAPNGEWEYYRQLQSVDFYGVHQSWTRFKEHFFINVSFNPQYEKLETRRDRRDELLKLLRKYSVYVDKEDVLTTPGRDFNIIPLTMPKDLMVHYRQLKKEMYVDIVEQGTLITAPSAAAAQNKLNQVTSGFIINTEEQETLLLSMYRFKELMKILDSLGDQQAIIWCNYHKEFDVISEMLGDRCTLVYGKIGYDEKTKNIRDFKEGKAQFLVANPASADKGLTLTNAHHAIYFSLNYSLELFEQSADRIYGDISKQPERCTYHMMQADKTIDGAIYKALINKGDVSMAVLNHLKGGS